MTELAEITRLCEVQKCALLSSGPPALAERHARLAKFSDMLVEHQDAITAAIGMDFGTRPEMMTKLFDIACVVTACKQAIDNLPNWARGESRPVEFPLNLLGASNVIEFQPKGCVGMIGPWNYPLLALAQPLAQAFAAGNSVVLKPSEFTPKFSALLQSLVAANFDESVLAVVTGGAEVGAHFSSVPWDHLVFTGATSVGKLVAKAAAENLTPVTLELGGKSPVIVSRTADLAVAARRVAHGKVVNAGQTCIAPDYVFVPRELRDQFAAELTTAVTSFYPSGVVDSLDYASVISERHMARLEGYLEDARALGCVVTPLQGGAASAGAAAGQQLPNRMPPTLVLEPPEEAAVSQEELFGPILVLKTYERLGECLAYVNAHPRPLALYYFGHDAAEERQVLDRTVSGGVCVNDVMMHGAQEDLPFGGVGASGSGCYKGYDGFREFSHAKPIHRQVSSGKQFLLDGIYPPYKDSMIPTILDTKLVKAPKPDSGCSLM